MKLQWLQIQSHGLRSPASAAYLALQLRELSILPWGCISRRFACQSHSEQMARPVTVVPTSRHSCPGQSNHIRNISRWKATGTQPLSGGRCMLGPGYQIPIRYRYRYQYRTNNASTTIETPRAVSMSTLSLVPRFNNYEINHLVLRTGVTMILLAITP